MHSQEGGGSTRALPFSSNSTCTTHRSGQPGQQQLQHQQHQHQHQPASMASLPSTPLPPSNLFTSLPLDQPGTPFVDMAPGYYQDVNALEARQLEHSSAYAASYRPYGDLAETNEGGGRNGASQRLDVVQQGTYYGAQRWEQHEQQHEQQQQELSYPPQQIPSFSAYPPPQTPSYPPPSYTSYPPSHAYSQPTHDNHYTASTSSSVRPSSQVGELYQPSLQNAVPLVPHLTAHDSRRAPFFPPSLPNRFATYPSTYSPLSSTLSSHHPTSSSAGSSSYPAENAIAGPSGLAGPNAPQHVSNDFDGRSNVAHEQHYHAENGSASSAMYALAPSASHTHSAGAKGKGRQLESSGMPTTVEDGLRAPAPTKRRREAKDVSMRKYVCAECDQRFARPSALATHILTHTKEKPFICFSCNRGFAVMSNLRRHCRVRSHVLAPSQEANGRPRNSRGAPAERRSIDSTASSSGSSGFEGGVDSLEPSPGANVAVLPALFEAGRVGEVQSVFTVPHPEKLVAFA